MTGRDRLRELLDAVLDEQHGSLAEMAGGAYASPYRFNRELSRHAGEPPVAMRRRVMLERAAWQPRHGTSVTEAAIAAGHDSVEGFSRAFSRAFGHPPSERPAGHYLPVPDGIHFHPPMSLWVESGTGPTGGDVTALMVHHDLDDTRDLMEAAKGMPEEEYRRPRIPGLAVLAWDGPDETLAQLLEHLVFCMEGWLASIEGEELGRPPGEGDPILWLRRRLQEDS